jgi:hypothetical protein
MTYVDHPADGPTIYRRFRADGQPSDPADEFHGPVQWRRFGTGEPVELRADRPHRGGPVVISGRPIHWRKGSVVLTDDLYGTYTESFSGPDNVITPCLAPLVLQHDQPTHRAPVLSARSVGSPDPLGLTFRWELREDLNPLTVEFLTSQAVPLSVSFRECHPDGSEFRQASHKGQPLGPMHRLPRKALIWHVAVVASPAYPLASTWLPDAS